MYSITAATRKISGMKARIRALQGGTSAGKTIGILEVLIDLAQRDNHQTLTSIVSESLPHLRRGAMKDFLSIMKEQDYYDDTRWDRTNSIYEFESGSKIEFFGADDAKRLRGARRDRLFINECNNVTFAAFEEMEVRTREFVFLDWNPTSEFWFYTEVEGVRTDVEKLVLTYLDNEALDPAIVASIEMRRSRPGWWKVYGLGQLGEVEGKIFLGWKVIDQVPEEARLERRSLDFGYTNDPSARVGIYRWNDAIVIDEELYMKGVTNKQHADSIKDQPSPSTLVVADSAEPKSIDEIRSYGVNITGAVKGPGSVLQGITAVQEQVVFVTRRSANVLHEQRNWLWKVDQTGKVLNVPEHAFSHSMMAIVYGVQSMIRSGGFSWRDELATAAIRRGREGAVRMDAGL